jgi:hypothetical protein
VPGLEFIVVTVQPVFESVRHGDELERAFGVRPGGFSMMSGTTLLDLGGTVAAVWWVAKSRR